MRLAHVKGVEGVLAIAGGILILVALGSLSEGWLFQHHSELFTQPILSHKQTASSTGGAVRILGRLEIPRLHVSTLIVEGTDDQSLRLGIGHIAGTSLPGESGNVALAAHRDTFFRFLRGIRIGEEVVLNANGGQLSYTIDSRKIVQPEEVSVLHQSDRSQITLVTCYPFGFIGDAPLRLILSGRVPANP